MNLSPAEKKAVTLYAVLTREASVFTKMIQEETSSEVLALLLAMLMFQEIEEESEKKLNKIGIDILEKEIAKRDLQ